MTPRRRKEDRSPAVSLVENVRQRAYCALRGFATVVGLPNVVLWAWKLARAGQLDETRLAGAVAFGLGLGALWAIRGAYYRTGIAVFLTLAGAFAAVDLITTGFDFGGAASLLGVAVLAGPFLGRTAAWVVLCLQALLLTIYGGALVATGHTSWAFWSHATMYLGWTACLLVTQGAIIGGMIRAARALVGEREQHLETERRLARAARMEAVGRLAAGVAHDTNNVLAVLKSGVDELRLLHPGAIDPELLEDMQHAVDAARGTMRQLTLISHVREADVAELETVAFLERFVRSLSRILPRAVTVELHQRSSGRVKVNEALLEQALLNLCLNARDAMPKGGAIKVSSLVDGEWVVLEVCDDGMGMDKDVQARLFEPFFTTKGEEKGTGLGLAMVQNFMQDAGGRVEVDSAPGAGTCMRLVLPRVP